MLERGGGRRECLGKGRCMRDRYIEVSRKSLKNLCRFHRRRWWCWKAVGIALSAGEWEDRAIYLGAWVAPREG